MIFMTRRKGTFFKFAVSVWSVTDGNVDGNDFLHRCVNTKIGYSTPTLLPSITLADIAESTEALAYLSNVSKGAETKATHGQNLPSTPSTYVHNRPVLVLQRTNDAKVMQTRTATIQMWHVF